MNARQQKHGDKHDCCDQEGKIHYLRHDIGQKIVFGHGRFLGVYSVIIFLLYMGLANRNYEDAIGYIFGWPQMKEPVPDKRGSCRYRRPGLSASSPKRWSVWRRGGSVDQCVEMKMPMFLGCTGKPSSADVTSVVYVRQRHPWTARFQPNGITDLEPLCHDLDPSKYHALALILRARNWRQEALSSPAAASCERTALCTGCERETLKLRSNTYV